MQFKNQLKYHLQEKQKPLIGYRREMVVAFPLFTTLEQQI